MNSKERLITEAYWREAKKLIPISNRLFAKKYFVAGFETCFTHIEVTEREKARRLKEISGTDKRPVYLKNIFKNLKMIFKRGK